MTWRFGFLVWAGKVKKQAGRENLPGRCEGVIARVFWFYKTKIEIRPQIAQISRIGFNAQMLMHAGWRLLGKRWREGDAGLVGLLA